MDTSKLVKIIKKIVREEVRRCVAPMVNEVLSEKFLHLLTEGRTSQAPAAVSAKVEPSLATMVEKTNLRENIKKKIIDGDPMKNLIYGDIDGRAAAQVSAASSALPGQYVDPEDDGVDLTVFTRNR